MTSKAKMFDGYANAYDQWFMKMKMFLLVN